MYSLDTLQFIVLYLIYVRPFRAGGIRASQRPRGERLRGLSPFAGRGGISPRSNKNRLESFLRGSGAGDADSLIGVTTCSDARPTTVSVRRSPSVFSGSGGLSFLKLSSQIRV